MNQPGYRRALRACTGRKGARRLAACGALAGAAAFAVWIRCGPLPAGFLEGSGQVSTVVTDRQGTVLYETLSAEGTRASILDATDLPPNLVAATVAAEDSRFFRHSGVDAIALARAALHDLRARRIVEGGSTITQQVVKMLTGTPRRTPGAKVREAVLALRLEHRLTKREILALYLNRAPYGNQFAGADRASRGYFGIPAGNLTLAQASFLAALPQRPSTYNPWRNRSDADRRARRILNAVRRRGLAPDETVGQALEEKVALIAPHSSLLAPHFVENVLASFGQRRPARVRTTLDAGLQREIEGIIASQRASLRRHGAANVAVVVLDNATGDWLAWEGSGDWLDTAGGAIDGATTPRQPGSALKPFTYALAFERGDTPATVLADIPSHFPTAEEGVSYSPRNYDGVFRGPLRARVALAGSENVPAVGLLARHGVPDLLRLFRRAGFTTFDRTADYYGLGLTLGNAEVRLDELVRAYAMLARGGTAVAARSVLEVEGKPIPPPVGGDQVVSPVTAFWVSDILSDPRAREYIFGSGGNLDFPFPVAVKTGTSQAYHDNWTIGYTREVTAGVWVGNFDRKQLRNSSGVTGAAPIFHQVMLAAETRVLGRFPTEADPPLASPLPGLERRRVCALSGEDVTPACPASEAEWLPADLPHRSCSWHAVIDGAVATSWPERYRAWAMEEGLADDRRVPQRVIAESRQPPGSQTSAVEIVNPPAGATYLIDPTLRSEFQTVALRAVVRGASRRVRWSVDGKPIGATGADQPLHWPLRPGKHEVAVQDERGRGDRTTFFVK